MDPLVLLGRLDLRDPVLPDQLDPQVPRVRPDLMGQQVLRDQPDFPVRPEIKDQRVRLVHQDLQGRVRRDPRDLPDRQVFPGQVRRDRRDRRDRQVQPDCREILDSMVYLVRADRTVQASRGPRDQREILAHRPWCNLEIRDRLGLPDPQGRKVRPEMTEVREITEPMELRDKD